MRQLVLCFLLLFLSFFSFAQLENTVYKNLETKKYYDVGGCPKLSNLPASVKFQINGSEVSELVYEKYMLTKDHIHCCPCILKMYDEFDVLLREGIMCQGGGVGYMKEYYPNGKVKVSGQYLENASGDWEFRMDHNFTNIPDGKWTYYKENGSENYVEYWNAGAFLQQEPVQATNEIWKVEYSLNGKLFDPMNINRETLDGWELTIKFKNNSIARDQYAVRLMARDKDKQKIEKIILVQSAQSLPFALFLKELGLTSLTISDLSVEVLDGVNSKGGFYRLFE